MKEKNDKVLWILSTLSKAYTNTTTLTFDNPWQLVVATIMSAQSRDVKVNEITNVLFKKYKTPEDFLSLSSSDMEEKIKSVNYFKTKSKRILDAAKMIQEKFDGQVPSSMEQLLLIPGIARKSANVIMSCAFHDDVGIVVDTHVSRLSQRLGLTKEKTPPKIELDLIKIVPREEWANFSHYLIYLGREFCISQKPKCENCLLKEKCPSAKKIQD